MTESAWKGQVPEEHHYPSAGPSVKQASPCECAKPAALVPALQGLELRDRNSGKHSLSADSKVGIFPNIDPAVWGLCGEITFISSTVPRTVLSFCEAEA